MHDLLEYSVVHGDHDHARNPERDGARDDGVDLVHDKAALVRVLLEIVEILLGRVPAEEDWRERDERRQDPHVGQHQEDRAFVQQQRILERTTNGEVSVINRTETVACVSRQQLTVGREQNLFGLRRNDIAATCQRIYSTSAKY
jgi:hypothetical protein